LNNVRVSRRLLS